MLSLLGSAWRLREIGLGGDVVGPARERSGKGGLKGDRQISRTATKPIRRARNGHPGLCERGNAPSFLLLQAATRLCRPCTALIFLASSWVA